MGKERYNLFLTGTTTTSSAKNETFSWSFDLKQLIPLDLRDKKFLLRTSFYFTEQVGTTNYATFQIGLNLPCSVYSRAVTPVTHTTVGFARANFSYNTNSFTYYYNERDCIVHTIDYPYLWETITLQLSNVTPNLASGLDFVCNLSFEPL